MGEIKKVLSVDVAFYNGNVRKGLFSVNLSSDGVNFTEVFNGSSSGTTLNLENYDFTDQDARYVKIIGYGNTQSLWNSITEARINFQEKSSGVKKLLSETISIYPNPMSGKLLYIKLGGEYRGSDQILLTDINGKILKNSPVNLTENIVEFDTALPPGVYLLSLQRNRISLPLVVK